MSERQSEIKPALRRGKWDHEKDMKLLAYINRFGIWNWPQMPKYADEN